MITAMVAAPRCVRRGWDAMRRRWALWSARRRLEVARYWHAHGDLDEAARHARRTLRMVSAARSAPLMLHAGARLIVAEIDRDRADYAASHMRLQSAVRLLEGVPRAAERDRLLIRALIGLGDCHRRSGRYHQATMTLRRARRVAETSDARDPMLLAAVHTVLGITAKELGNYDEAAHRYAVVASIYSEFPAAPADQATLHHNLAGLAYARAQYSAAESHARRAVELRYQAKAAKVDLAADLAVLGAAIAAQRRHAEARDHLERALAICRAAQPPRRYEIAVHLHNLAAIDQADGQREDAERRYREALAIKEQVLGAHHPEIGLLCNNLGTLLHEQQREAEAAECYRRALRVTARAYPLSHPTITATRGNFERLEDLRVMLAP